MKLLIFSQRTEEGRRRMVARASTVIGRLKANPDYFERIHLLVLVDILELFMNNELPHDEAQLVAQTIRSERVQELMNRLLDVNLWMRTKEGQSWIEKLNTKSQSI